MPWPPQLGIPRRGYQVHRRSAALNHYDLPESYRLKAIELGARPGDLAGDGPPYAGVAARWRSARPTRSSMMRSKE